MCVEKTVLLSHSRFLLFFQLSMPLLQRTWKTLYKIPHYSVSFPIHCKSCYDSHQSNHSFYEDSLSNLQALEGLDQVYDLYKKFMRPILIDVSSSPELWTVHCPERLIFQTLMLNSGINLNLSIYLLYCTCWVVPKYFFYLF